MLSEVTLDVTPLDRFDALIGPVATRDLRSLLGDLAQRLAGRALWHVNSTATGGGVAEMLPVLLAYLRGAGVDARWAVVGGDPEFFEITKRIHNRLHGSGGDGGELGEAQRRHYRGVCGPNAEALSRHVQPGEVVVLHDPQTAGLATPLRNAGARVVWRCHVGADQRNHHVEEAWAFLRPELEDVDVFVFSRRAHVHDWIPPDRVRIVPPSIDPFAPKNQDLDGPTVRAIVQRLGLLHGREDAPATFRRRDGSVDTIRGAAHIVRGGAPRSDDAPLVLQVSRWDRLKDMPGVMRGFAAGVDHGAHLALVGPEVRGVSDDPEGAEVLTECAVAWDTLPPPARDRIHLVCLPMDDRDENAAMVNALQRHAALIVQKSLAEGFGLTVTEAMWKARPVVASAVGGIQDQIVSGEHGLLVADPTDLAAFARMVAGLLTDEPEAARLGTNARARVVERFLPTRHLAQYTALFNELVDELS